MPDLTDFLSNYPPMGEPHKVTPVLGGSAPIGGGSPPPHPTPNGPMSAASSSGSGRGLHSSPSSSSYMPSDTGKHTAYIVRSISFFSLSLSLVRCWFAAGERGLHLNQIQNGRAAGEGAPSVTASAPVTVLGSSQP